MHGRRSRATLGPSRPVCRQRIGCRASLAFQRSQVSQERGCRHSTAQHITAHHVVPVPCVLVSSRRLRLPSALQPLSLTCACACASTSTSTSAYLQPSHTYHYHHRHVLLLVHSLLLTRAPTRLRPSGNYSPFVHIVTIVYCFCK